MGRIVVFVVLIAGAGYFVIDLVTRRLFGAAVSPTVAVSLAVLLAVVLWTVLIWRFGDRLGQPRDEAGPKQP